MTAPTASAADVMGRKAGEGKWPHAPAACPTRGIQRLALPSKWSTWICSRTPAVNQPRTMDRSTTLLTGTASGSGLERRHLQKACRMSSFWHTFDHSLEIGSISEVKTTG